MNVVVDTNVFISGIFFTGPPHEILQAWHSGTLTFIISLDIHEEYARVANELSDKFPGINLSSILQLVYVHSILVNPHPLPTAVCTDPDDDKFIAAALTGNAAIIISGDKHLHAISGYQGISVLSPREFTQYYLR